MPSTSFSQLAFLACGIVQFLFRGCDSLIGVHRMVNVSCGLTGGGLWSVSTALGVPRLSDTRVYVCTHV